MHCHSQSKATAQTGAPGSAGLRKAAGAGAGLLAQDPGGEDARKLLSCRLDGWLIDGVVVQELQQRVEHPHAIGGHLHTQGEGLKGTDERPGR